MTEDDRAFLLGVMERSSMAYPHAKFAAFYWSVKHRRGPLNLTGFAGSRLDEVQQGGDFDAWLPLARTRYAAGSEGLHKLSLDALCTAMRDKRKQRAASQPSGFPATVGVGLFQNLYEFAIVAYGAYSFGHGRVYRPNDVFGLINSWSPAGAAGFISLVRDLEALAQEPFDIISAVNQKIQDARIDWQRQIIPNAGFYGRHKRSVRIT